MENQRQKIAEVMIGPAGLPLCQRIMWIALGPPEHRRAVWIIAAVLLLLWLATGAAHATPGGLDQDGCHIGRRVGYHCHGGASARPRHLTTSTETTRERERRLRRECRGAPNAGACLGFGG